MIEQLITDHLDLWSSAVRPKSSAGRGSNSKLELTGNLGTVMQESAKAALTCLRSGHFNGAIVLTP